MDNKNKSFESGVKELESIVKRLESEDTPLDEMLALYEEANKLSDFCRDKLKAANKKMTELSKKNNIIEEVK